MSVDPFLLATARAAARTLQDAERAIEPLRQDSRACIRSLSAGGASLREIAAALGLSHQRVHQLVQGEARPKSTRTPAESTLASVLVTGGATCALCGEEAEIEGGGSPPLCAACRKDGRLLMAGEMPADVRGLRLVRRHQRPHCLGCRRLPDAGEVFLAGPQGALCAGCLERRE